MELKTKTTGSAKCRYVNKVVSVSASPRNCYSFKYIRLPTHATLCAVRRHPASPSYIFFEEYSRLSPESFSWQRVETFTLGTKSRYPTREHASPQITSRTLRHVIRHNSISTTLVRGTGGRRGSQRKEGK